MFGWQAKGQLNGRKCRGFTDEEVENLESRNSRLAQLYALARDAIA